MVARRNCLKRAKTQYFRTKNPENPENADNTPERPSSGATSGGLWVADGAINSLVSLWYLLHAIKIKSVFFIGVLETFWRETESLPCSSGYRQTWSDVDCERMQQKSATTCCAVDRRCSAAFSCHAALLIDAVIVWSWFLLRPLHCTQYRTARNDAWFWSAPETTLLRFYCTTLAVHTAAPQFVGCVESNVIAVFTFLYEISWIVNSSRVTFSS